MKFSNKVFILTFLFFVLTILTPLLTIRSSNEKIILPSEGSKSYPIRLKGGWVYFFEVTSWSGDEIINITLLADNDLLLSDILRGDSLEGDWEPYDWEDVGPSFGNDFQVQETTNCTLIVNVIASPTQRETHLQLVGTDQYALGIDGGILTLGFLALTIISFFVAFIASVFDLFWLIRSAKEQPPNEEII